MQELITNGDNIIHLVASSKGGVGKSFVCWNFAEYLYNKGAEFYVADTDPSTPTFLNYVAFNVNHIILPIATCGSIGPSSTLYMKKFSRIRAHVLSTAALPRSYR